MQFAIITALISIITLSFKYMEESMNNTDYSNLLILNHSIIKQPYKYKLILLEIINNYIVTISILLLILSTGLSIKYMRNNTMLLILIILVMVFISCAINFFTIIKLTQHIHHSIDASDINMQFRSMIIPSASIGIVLGYSWLKNSIEFFDKPFIDYAVIIFIFFMPIIYYRKLLENSKVKDDKDNEFKAVKPDSNIIIQTKENLETKEIKIDIIKNNISIDKDGYVWVYNRNNVKEDIAYYKLDENTTLKIDGTTITNKSADSNTNYTKYI